MGVAAVSDVYTRTRKSRSDSVPPEPPKFAGGSQLKNAFVLPGAASTLGGVDGTVQTVASSDPAFGFGPGSVVLDATDAESVSVRAPSVRFASAVTFTRTCVVSLVGVPSFPFSVPIDSGRVWLGEHVEEPKHAPTNVTSAGSESPNETFCASDGPLFVTSYS